MFSRPLKRSASVASLPTPPRTHHKRHHSRVDSESESESEAEQELEVALGSKRRKTDEDDEQEESDFWNSSSSKADSSTKQTSSSNRAGNAKGEHSAPLLYRLKRTQSTSSQPLTPPPSHRKSSATVSNKDSCPSPTSLLPHTPTSGGVSPPRTPMKCSDKPSLLRDSPDNPFLTSPPGAALSGFESEQNEEEEGAESGEELVEKPTMEFVYRGTHRTYDNPYYNRSSPPPSSLLPIDHPDYEMDERGGSMSYTRLFGVPKRKTKSSKAQLPRTTPNTNTVQETTIVGRNS